MLRYFFGVARVLLFLPIPGAPCTNDGTPVLGSRPRRTSDSTPASHRKASLSQSWCIWSLQTTPGLRFEQDCSVGGSVPEPSQSQYGTSNRLWPHLTGRKDMHN